MTALRTHPAAMVVMVYVLCFELWKVMWAPHWLAAVPALHAEVHGGFCLGLCKSIFDAAC